MPGIAALLSRSFDNFREHSPSNIADLYHHLYYSNPWRTPRHVLGWVLESTSGDIVGFEGLVPIKLKIGNASVIGGSGTSWAVDPEYRSQSLSLYKEFVSWGEENFLVITTASDLVTKLNGLFKFKLRRIPVKGFNRRLLWIVRPKALVKWRLSNANNPYLNWFGNQGSAVVNPLASLVGMRYGRHGSLKFQCQPLSVEPVTDFTPEFDVLWDEQKHHYGITTVRDQAFQHWRHTDLPRLAGESFVFACRDNRKLMGYIAVQRKDTVAGVPGHFVVSDIFFDLDRRDVLHNLMNCAFEFVKDSNGSLFEVTGFNPAIIDEMMQQNPYVVESPIWTYWYEAPSPELWDSASTEEWWPSGIDGDLNI